MSTKLPPLRVKSLVWQSGERFAMIVDDETGVPLLLPTVYAMGQLRSADLSFSTIKQAMYAVRIFVHFAYVHDIDLSRRMHVEGKLLEANEVEKLASLCRLPSEILEDELHELLLSKERKARIGPNIERFRAKTGKNKIPQVDRQTSNIRLYYIRDYLKWLSEREIIRMAETKASYEDVRANIALALSLLASKQVAVRNRKNVNVRKRGLAEDVIARLHQVIDPESPENPWRPGFNRYRNRLYIYWLLGLSLRKGESLGVMLEDINSAGETVAILRRPDNPKDKRGAYAPLAKTRDRVLVISDELLAYTEEYLTMRRKYVKASKHGYLFVSSRDGVPLSQSAARDIFLALRSKVPGIPARLSAQILRHTWNTLFTSRAFEMKMPEQQRKSTMRNQNGWSDRSEMPDYYSVAAIEREARKESLEMQRRIHKLAQPKG